MSNKITSGGQLEAFLKRLVNESMGKAEEELINLRENSISHLREQEEEEEVEEEEVEEEVEEEAVEEEPAEEEPAEEIEIEDEEEDVEADSEADEKDPMQRQSAEDRAPKRPETGSEVTLGNILYDINQIRSGRSLKDPEVKTNLEDYFNRLSNAERMALSEFLEGLTDVIVKGIPAEDAEDPGDEVKMSEPDAPASAEEVEVETEEETEEKVAEKPAEDLTPPIQVRR